MSRKDVQHPPVVYLEWIDAGTPASGWVEENDLPHLVEALAKPIAAVGFLLEQTEAHVLISAVYNSNNGDSVAQFWVPRPNVVRMVQIRGKRGTKVVKP